VAGKTGGVLVVEGWGCDWGDGWGFVAFGVIGGKMSDVLKCFSEGIGDKRKFGDNKGFSAVLRLGDPSTAACFVALRSIVRQKRSLVCVSR
jgi:hypothetical protein